MSWRQPVIVYITKREHLGEYIWHAWTWQHQLANCWREIWTAACFDFLTIPPCVCTHLCVKCTFVKHVYIGNHYHDHTHSSNNVKFSEVYHVKSNVSHHWFWVWWGFCANNFAGPVHTPLRSRYWRKVTFSNVCYCRKWKGKEILLNGQNLKKVSIVCQYYLLKGSFRQCTNRLHSIFRQLSQAGSESLSCIGSIFLYFGHKLTLSDRNWGNYLFCTNP